MQTFMGMMAAVAALIAGAAMAQEPAAEPPPAPVPAVKPGLAEPPAGWAYLPELAVFGPAPIFHVVPGSDGGPATQMDVHTRRNVGILTRDVDVPLTAATQLRWRWKVDQLPSAKPELLAANHDYLSIAVKFENGKDLTYMWSAGMEPGLGFECPLPGWGGREYHVVIRSGPRDLGAWLAETRDVAADYARHVGGPMPGRIVQVWFIANSIIQQGEGKARFGDIQISPGTGGTAVSVF